jgi:hypothetical protein
MEWVTGARGIIGESRDCPAQVPEPMLILDRFVKGGGFEISVKKANLLGPNGVLSKEGENYPHSIRRRHEMKKALLLSAALVLATSASAQTWFKGTLDQAVAKAQTDKKLVLLDFYSSG